MTEPTTPTPRTDAVLQKVRARLATCAPSLANLQAIQEMAIVTLAENGKRLERELADETRNADVMSRAIFGPGGWQDVAIGLRRELAQMTAERDAASMEAVTLTDQLTEARKALGECMNHRDHPTHAEWTRWHDITMGERADTGEGA